MNDVALVDVEEEWSKDWTRWLFNLKLSSPNNREKEKKRAG